MSRGSSATASEFDPRIDAVVDWFANPYYDTALCTHLFIQAGDNRRRSATTLGHDGRGLRALPPTRRYTTK